MRPKCYIRIGHIHSYRFLMQHRRLHCVKTILSTRQSDMTLNKCFLNINMLLWLLTPCLDAIKTLQASLVKFKIIRTKFSSNMANLIYVYNWK